MCTGNGGGHTKWKWVYQGRHQLLAILEAHIIPWYSEWDCQLSSDSWERLLFPQVFPSSVACKTNQKVHCNDVPSWCSITTQWNFVPMGQLWHYTITSSLVTDITSSHVIVNVVDKRGLGLKFLKTNLMGRVPRSWCQPWQLVNSEKILIDFVLAMQGNNYLTIIMFFRSTESHSLFSDTSQFLMSTGA